MIMSKITSGSYCKEIPREGYDGMNKSFPLKSIHSNQHEKLHKGRPQQGWLGAIYGDLRACRLLSH